MIRLEDFRFVTGTGRFTDDLVRPGTARGGVEIIEPKDANGKPVVRRLQDGGAFTLVATVRLAKPHSVWARRFYARDPAKMGRAERRWERTEAVLNRFRDALAGAPSEPDPDSD